MSIVSKSQPKSATKPGISTTCDPRWGSTSKSTQFDHRSDRDGVHVSRSKTLNRSSTTSNRIRNAASTVATEFLANDVVEKKLAALEGSEEGVLFSTGMAAFVGLLNAKLSSGDEIVFFDECYHRSRDYCRTYLSRFGVVTREVKTGDYDAMEAAINDKTKLLVSESPTNPHLKHRRPGAICHDRQNSRH